MKVFAAVAAAVALVAQTIAYSTDPCPPGEMDKLLQLASEPQLGPCQDLTGYYFVPPSGYPTDDQIFLLCMADSCRTTLATLTALNPSDCVTTFGGVSLNVKNITDSYKPKCKSLGFEW